MKIIPIFLLSLLITITTIAQNDCSPLVEDALTTVDTLCEGIQRNEVCYGNNLVTVTLTEGEVDFSQPGQTTSITNIQSIHTGPYIEPDQWGIALMCVQTHQLASLPGQCVTFLLFGDVNLTNAGSTETILSASTTGNINVRSGPSTNYATAGSLQGGMAIDLIGRNVVGDWVYFTTEESSGWLFSSLLQIEGDVMTLAEVADDFSGEVTSSAPMEAVYFSSGIGQTTCSDVPQDGILIQTPDFDEPIELTINDVEIQLGSTAYLQAEAGGEMTVAMLEGYALVTANEETVYVPAGAVTTVQIDEDLHATSTPSDPEPYITEDVSSAPVSTMEEPIEVAEPATDEDISGQTVIIDGNASWIDTGIQVSEGQTIYITASGAINVFTNCETYFEERPEIEDPVDCDSTTFGPDGGWVTRNGQTTPPHESVNFVAPDIMAHSLIGRIGEADPFFIGGNVILTAPVNGTLYLRLNDGVGAENSSNNSGEFIVTIYAP